MPRSCSESSATVGPDAVCSDRPAELRREASCWTRVRQRISFLAPRWRDRFPPSLNAAHDAEGISQPERPQPLSLDILGAVRIATWNVNSVKQRLPRLLPWLDERQPDVVCLQETKLDRRRVSRAARGRARRPRLRGRRSRRGGVERRGDPLARRARRRGGRHPRRAGLPASGGARRVRHLWRDPGRLGVRAERARARLRPLRVQARLAGLAARDGRRRARGDGRLRRLQHRPHRRRRLRPRRLRRPDARDASPSARPWQS